MSAQPRKRVADSAMSMKHVPAKKSSKDMSTDYTKCIICQQESVMSLFFIQLTTYMNKLKALRIHSGRSKLIPYDDAFSRLVDELEAPLFHDLSRFLVASSA